MTKLIAIIYYVIELIERILKRKKLQEARERREEIKDDPSTAFKNKFRREDGAPVDYEEESK